MGDGKVGNIGSTAALNSAASAANAGAKAAKTETSTNPPSASQDKLEKAASKQSTSSPNNGLEPSSGGVSLRKLPSSRPGTLPTFISTFDGEQKQATALWTDFEAAKNNGFPALKEFLVQLQATSAIDSDTANDPVRSRVAARMLFSMYNDADARDNPLSLSPEQAELVHEWSAENKTRLFENEEQVLNKLALKSIEGLSPEHFVQNPKIFYPLYFVARTADNKARALITRIFNAMNDTPYLKPLSHVSALEIATDVDNIEARQRGDGLFNPSARYDFEERFIAQMKKNVQTNPDKLTEYLSYPGSYSPMVRDALLSAANQSLLSHEQLADFVEQLAKDPEAWSQSNFTGGLDKLLNRASTLDVNQRDRIRLAAGSALETLFALPKRPTIQAAVKMWAPLMD